MFKRNIFICLFLALVISCGGDGKEMISLHPMQEKMAYADHETIMLELNEVSGLNHHMPKSLLIIHQYLNNETTSGFITNDLSVLTTDKVQISTINDSSILILEPSNNRLIQYDIEINSYEIISDQGRGPGDLYFAEELSTFNDKAFVGMQGFQLSIFDCSMDLCVYEKTINTDFNNYSIDATEDQIYVLGISPFGNPQDSDPLNSDHNLFHILNYQGDVLNSFHPAYDDRSPLVRNRLSSGGMIKTYSNKSLILIAFDFFPYLYEYEAGGDLTNIFQIDNFVQPIYESKESLHSGFSAGLIYGNKTVIDLTTRVDDEWLFLRLYERRNIGFDHVNVTFTGDEWYTYLAYNVERRELYKLGDDIKTTPGDSRVLHVLDQGIMVNNDGKLKYITR
ncbi:hypothetical protein DYD21_15530 [Rhodohalobacter sp. SW132]|uniref:hypothetical protein n=1 Tax=Rhodohalobacter sp. SW132 TaxID=2293433 RepID=UPI000E243F07|nr:hypothetical protein [Rhodohalobacter sp. SW132]REL24934.1 hypothetical protein DYD21_15530 [Rhodohalobacter sp. SW132]